MDKIILVNESFDKLNVGAYIEYEEEVTKRQEMKNIKGVIVNKYKHFLMVLDGKGLRWTINKMDLLDKVNILKYVE